MRSGSAHDRPPPGRPARSPAMIVRSPESGSTRTSGKRLLHRQVLDAGVEEDLTPGAVAGALVEPQRRRLRGQDHLLASHRPRPALGLAEQRAADAAPA